MLRKTNLIQIVNNTQAEFITFSNYTEAMTGAVLSLHTHLVPTAFMCFNMEAAKTEMGRLLIKNILTYYYENKLAFLRDYMLDTDGVTFENDCHPLAYLLIALNMAETMFKTGQNVIATAPKAFTRAITNNNLDLVYVSEVTEQSYNGVFSDIILTVDSSDIKNYNITFNNDYNTRTQNIPESEKFDVKELYGWSYYNPKAENSHGIPGNKWECKVPSGY